MDDEQREDMVALLHVVVEKHYGEDYQYPGETLRRLLDGTTADQLIAELGVMDQEILEGAKVLLRPGQHNALRAYREKRAAGGAQHVRDMVAILEEKDANAE